MIEIFYQHVIKNILKLYNIQKTKNIIFLRFFHFLTITINYYIINIYIIYNNTGGKICYFQ
jgi:hypothetical protein